eukprot:10783135-Alexandrium_andersonii.AAC.1
MFFLRFKACRWGLSRDGVAYVLLVKNAGMAEALDCQAGHNLARGKDKIAPGPSRRRSAGASSRRSAARGERTRPDLRSGLLPRSALAGSPRHPPGVRRPTSRPPGS